jgi:hypothetical protein
MVLALVCCAASARACRAAPEDWACAVLEYVRGANAASAYTNAHAALGEAARETLDWSTTALVTVINPAWLPSQIVSIGDGGHVTLALGADAINEDDPVHPYGVDLLVYGNALFGTASTASFYASPWVGISGEPADIWVSADSQTWCRARARFADWYMPTQAVDVNGDPSDYLRPINPALLTNEWFEADPPWSYSNTVAAYDGAAGGCPVDLGDLLTSAGAPTNLPWVRYVKIADTSGNGSTELDAVARVAAVPEGVGASAILLLVWLRSARRHA